MSHSKPAVLVTGCAGYIGSHAVLALLDAGWQPIGLDNLSNGSRDAVPAGVPFHAIDAGDTAEVRAILERHRVRAVLHFAGSTSVPESMEKPLLYYHNNTTVSRCLIEACAAAGVAHFVFSSTAAVYGEPGIVQVDESVPPNPISPYGQSKLMVERILADSAGPAGMTYAALRYFNVAGADPQGRTGQRNPRACHLIKVACEAVLGRRDGLDIFGTDYDTRDGTGVRDFIHVTDLVDAHVLALDHLFSGGASTVMNCGYGRGYTVREVAEAIARVAGRPLTVRERPRRAGDIGALIAESSRLKHTLGWQPRHDDLDAILRHTLAWERRLSLQAAS